MELFFLLWLPTFIAASINISVKPATYRDKNLTVLVSGSSKSRITEKEAKIFKLTHSAIFWGLATRGYKQPTHIHVLDSGYYGYRPVETTMRPIKATIIGQEKQSVIIAEKEFHNNSSVPSIFKGGIREEIQETVSSTWSENIELSVSRDMNLKYASQSVSFSSSWGKSIHHSITKTLSTTTDIEVSLKPGQSVKLILSATKVLLKFKVEYEASVSGEIYCQYTFFFIPYQGQEFDVKKYFDLMKMPNSITSTETMCIDYYYGAHAIVKDIKNGESLFTEPVLMF